MRISLNISLLLFNFLLGNVHAQCTFERFESYYPVPYTSNMSLITLRDGGFLFMTSGTNDTLQPGFENDGSFDIQLLRTDSCGNKLWNIFVGQAEGNYASSLIETDSGNFLIVGEYGDETGFRIIKVNAAGNLIWEKRYLQGTNGVSGNSIVKLKNNQFLVDGVIVFSNGYALPFIIQIDENGNIIRSKNFYDTFKQGPPSHCASLFVKNDSTYIACFYVPYKAGLDTYYDIAIVSLDTLFAVKSYFNVIGLNFGSDTIYGSNETHVIKPVGKNGILLNGTIFRKYGNYGGSSVKISLSGNIVAGFHHTDSIKLRYDHIPITPDNGFLSFSANGILVLDSNFLPIRRISYTPPVKGFLYNSFVLNNYSIVFLGISAYRKVKTSDSDSLIRPFAQELYIIKMDSNGNFTPTTWNSIAENQDDNTFLSIFPNPASSHFQISCKKTGHYLAELYNLSGQKINTTSFSGDNTTISLDAYQTGMYLLRLVNTKDNTAYMQKLLITR